MFESGFARVPCTSCPNEFLVAFSCKGRGLCPSCGAKRAAIFSELLQHQILADVPHAQWVFSIPKMIRPYFLRHRELLGDMARPAYETVREMMAAAADEPHAEPGMVGVIQTFASSLRWNPHIHSIASRGVWAPSGEWIPYVNEHKAELLFRHKILSLLRDQGLISREPIDLLLSWGNSGFSVHNRTTVYPNDNKHLVRFYGHCRAQGERTVARPLQPSRNAKSFGTSERRSGPHGSRCASNRPFLRCPRS